MITCARLRLLSMVLEFRCQNHGFPYNRDSCKRSSLCCGFNMLPVLALCQSLSESLNLNLDLVQRRLCHLSPPIQPKGLGWSAISNVLLIGAGCRVSGKACCGINNGQGGEILGPNISAKQVNYNNRLSLCESDHEADYNCTLGQMMCISFTPPTTPKILISSVNK